MKNKALFATIGRMDDKFLKPYDPQETEDRIYKRWLESDYFNPDTCIEKGVAEPEAEIFSMVLPPPNVTGTLHTGHATMLAIEDIYARFNRMRGKRTLWIPGTDHAAIATQSKVEKDLQKKEKKNRHDLGREEFLKRVEAFAQESHDTIVHQVQRMGSSLDWSREAYTLDDSRREAVTEAFVRMYNAGLIYRGNRIVNWDPKGQTTISDDEIVYEEQHTTLYTFRYSPDIPISISTTRPETKLGDTGIAVHPEDGRYKHYVGKTFSVDNFAGEELSLTVVADENIDSEYGTGAVGITPAHSHTDAEIAQRHDLPSKQIINEYGKMMVGVEGVYDQKAHRARERVVEWLKEQNLMDNEREITHNVATAERSGAVVEPLPKLQWFINVTKPFPFPSNDIRGIEKGQEVTLKEVLLQVVKNDQIDIIPERFEKIYFHWIENLGDWCISRQIWYGHRIPAWHKDEQIYVGHEPPTGDGWEKDLDTLDTWFSAGLWPFSTLGWPKETDDIETYYPTSLLETGYDILFFWVARMILMSTFLTGNIPFRTVYLHGLVRDEKGVKMSKSLGNIIDPVELVEEFGADATRMALIIGTTPGNDSTISKDKTKAYKHFSNKIWNITRFVLTNTEDFDGSGIQPSDLLEGHASWKEEFDATAREITSDIESFRFSLAGEKLYQYVWHTFADQILEETKPNLYENGEDAHSRRSAQWVLLYILTNSLKLLHPFMPFVTEDIWGRLPKNAKSSSDLLLVQQWPY